MANIFDKVETLEEQSEKTTQVTKPLEGMNKIQEKSVEDLKRMHNFSQKVFMIMQQDESGPRWEYGPRRGRQRMEPLCAALST